MKPTGKFPACEKLRSVSKDSQKIGEFLGWLTDEKGYQICESTKSYNCPFSPVVGISIERLLAEYFEVDLEQVERERRAILESIRD